MRRLTILIPAFTVVLLMVSCGEKRRPRNYNTVADSANFIADASSLSQKQTEASLAAKNTSKNTRVVKFADMLLTYHTSLHEKIRALHTKGQATPADTLSLENQQLILRLSEYSGLRFDKEYLKMVAADHKKMADMFKDASKSTDKQIRRLAAGALPTLKAYVDSARTIERSLK